MRGGGGAGSALAAPPQQARTSSPFAPTATRCSRWALPAGIGLERGSRAGAWRAFAQGCRCNQETLALLERQGLRVVELARADWRGMPSLVRPLVIGEAA